MDHILPNGRNQRISGKNRSKLMQPEQFGGPLDGIKADMEREPMVSQTFLLSPMYQILKFVAEI